MLRRSSRLSARARSLASDRVSLALLGVFVLAAVFYLWRSTYAQSLDLYGGQEGQYNQLADAFLHLRLWLVHVPEAALGPGNPYNPAERSAFLSGYPDYVLYGHYLYITWGPAPVLALLIPLHLLGFEPSASVISAPFAIAGIGFALATLRVILRQIGRVSLWMCGLAGLTLACASTIPFDLRFPLVYHEEIAGAYCFSMVAVWLVAKAVTERRASLKRLVLLSLFLGLAAGSRPTLVLLALLLVPVYKSLRPTLPSRSLMVALLTPIGVCGVLLLAYNQARFGSPFEYGARYQINGPSTYNAHFAELGYLAPGLWSYLFAPPRLIAIFPFLQIIYPQISYPFGLPAHYAPLSEETGGLFAMAPIAIFLLALPWMWRRRPALLGTLAPLLTLMAVVGVGAMLFVSYEIYITTQRYETDYITLMLFGAIAAWLALSSTTQGRTRRLVRFGGALLAVWSCVTGLAISGMELEKHQSTWREAVSLGSPLSTAIATIAGRPVLAEVSAPTSERSPPNYSNIGTDTTGFSLTSANEVNLTIVSPDHRTAALVADVSAGPALGAGGTLEAHISGGGHASYGSRVRVGGQVRIPVYLHRGVNELALRAVEGAGNTSQPEPESQVLATFTNLSLAG
jgi:hypothetical protein